MKVYENIERSNYPDKEALKRVINDLIPLRDDRRATEIYFEKYLETDIKWKKWQKGKRECELNGDLHLNPQYSEFELLPGAIEPKNAKAFRKELLTVISDDKYSFGYLYFLLASETNREASTVNRSCVPIPDEIKYCIDFDIDELDEQIKAENDLHKIFRLIEDKRSESKKSVYKGDKKTIFEDYCESKINAICNEIDIFGKQQEHTNDLSDTKITEQIRVFPAELDTDEARAIFQKAVYKGFMNEDFSFIGTNYQKAYFAERAAEALNLKYKWKPFETLWNCKHLAQTRRESMERFGYVDKQDEIDSIFS